MNKLDERIKNCIDELGTRFSSEEAYRHIAESISAGALIQDKNRILRERTRGVLRRWMDESGKRSFENVPIVGEDGSTSHEWIQPKLMDLVEAEATVQQTAKIAVATCHKANSLARRFKEVQGYAIQVPFPWLEESAGVGG